MAKKKKTPQGESALQNVEASLSRVEQYIEDNRNIVMGVMGGIVAIAALIWAYNNLYVKPLEAEAQEMIYPAQRYLEQDSLRLAVNGDGQNMGFVEVAEEYGSTKAGKMARYYAGVCYLNMGEYTDAIQYLDKFSSNDGTFNVVAKGAIGDAFMELNQPEEALEYYEKAVDLDGNDFLTPVYLKKAAQTAEILENWKAAIKHYKRLQTEYPFSEETTDVEKFIAYCEQKARNS